MVPPVADKHRHHHETSAPTPLMKVMVTISRVALAVFACLADAPLFAFSFAAGFLLSAIWGHKSVSVEEAAGGCSEGVLEKIAGTKFPAEASFLLGAMTLACHIEHHATVFVPAVGLSVGYWAGQKLQSALSYGKPISAT